MARIIVTTDRTERPDLPVLLDERVCSAHLNDKHAAAQLVERLAWAITDAEDAESAQAARAPSPADRELLPAEPVPTQADRAPSPTNYTGGTERRARHPVGA